MKISVKAIVGILQTRFPNNRITFGSISAHSYIKIHDMTVSPEIDLSEFECDKYEWFSQGLRKQDGAVILTRFEK